MLLIVSSSFSRRATILIILIETIYNLLRVRTILVINKNNKVLSNKLILVSFRINPK